MVRVVYTGDVSFIYTPSESTEDVISAIPMPPGKGAPVLGRDSVMLFDKSPQLRKLAAKNMKLFNPNNYKTAEEYELALRRILEILPGAKSYLFFGGDICHIDQFAAIVKVAGSISFKTWVIKISDDTLLNDYFLGSVVDGIELPSNVWIYKYGDYGDNVLYDYPKITYETSPYTECDELEQFPEKYADFTVKLYER